MSLRFIHVVIYSMVCLIQLLCGIPLCVHVTVHLPYPVLMDIWVVSILTAVSPMLWPFLSAGVTFPHSCWVYMQEWNYGWSPVFICSLIQHLLSIYYI